MASRPTRQRLTPDFPYRCPASQKACFRTKAEALDSAERMMERGHVRPGCHITPYLCQECREWHVANRVIVPLGSNRPGQWVDRGAQDAQGRARGR